MLRKTVSTDTAAPDRSDPDRRHGDGGQTLPEYALVMVGAAALAALLLTWVSNADALGSLLDGVMDNVIGRIF